MPAAPQPVRDGSRRWTESSIRSSHNVLLCAKQREDTPLLHHHQTQSQDGTLQVTQQYTLLSPSTYLHITHTIIICCKETTTRYHMAHNNQCLHESKPVPITKYCKDFRAQTLVAGRGQTH
jgi:hypothetical protein